MSLSFSPTLSISESITSHSGSGTGTSSSSSAVSLGKRKKSTDEVNNNHNSSNGAPGHEEDGVNVEDSGDEGSLSRGEAQRKKKARTTFTGRQIFELEKQFELKKYLSSSERADMAKLLNVTETQVGACCDAICPFSRLVGRRIRSDFDRRSIHVDVFRLTTSCGV